MDIRNVGEKEKEATILKIKDSFKQIRQTLDTLEEDICSEDLMKQASSVWVSGNLCSWFYDFMKQLHGIYLEKNAVQAQIKEACESVKNDKENDDG